MASTNLDDIGVRTLRVPDFALGINTAKPPTELQDNEVQDLRNFEFDDNGNISTRRGVSQLSADTFGSRITSLHYFTTESGEVGILLTTGTTLRIIETNGTGLSTLSGALTLPNDTYWSWVTFNGIAIGCNKATSGDNPIKVSAAAAATALPGSPPKAKYAAVWNNRVWLVSATEPNQLWGSKLGDPENWTDTTVGTGRAIFDVDTDDGDQITGIYPTREALYIFKRRSIHRLIAGATPNTDPRNLRLEVLTRNIGCVSHYSISQVVDDVLFLADPGVASLSLVVTAENFRTAFYSRNIAELERFPKTTEEIPHLLCDTGSQYWLSLPATVSPTGSAQAYVMDYAKVADGFTRWTRFDGPPAGTAYTSFMGASGKVFVIGAPNGAGSHQLYTYIPRNPLGTFSDNGVAYTKSFTTKSFNDGAQLLRKHYYKWGLGVNLLSESAQLQVDYFLDGNPQRGGSYGLTLEGVETGALWGPGLWGAGLWGSQFSGAFDIVRRLRTNQFGKRAQDVTFKFANSQINQGFTMRDFMLMSSPLTEKGVDDTI